MTRRFWLNGDERTVAAAPTRRMSAVLRDDLGLTGTKSGCDAGDCGACTILLDDAPVCACLTPVAQVGERRVTTIEGVSGPELSMLQAAFLRHGAAQCGICTPGMIMAATALLRREKTPSRAAVEAALGGVLCRCTGYQKIIDAVCDAGQIGPEDGTPPAGPAIGAAIGAGIARLDGVPKLTGAEIFGADFSPPDALLVRAIRSPHASARFDFGDLAGWAAAHPEIVAILTAADIPGRNAFGVIPAFVDQPALADGEVRFRGEAVALVVGPEDAVACLSLDAFPVIWQARDPVTETDTARQKARIHESRADNILITGRVVTGDADHALAQATHLVSGQFSTGYVEHAYIEPEAGIAWLDGDILTIQAATQAPVMDQEETAAVLGLSPAQVRIIPAATGGGFGAKLDLSVQPLIGLATLKTGRPCRMVFSRTESMQASTKRHPAQMRAQIGADAEGRIMAMRFDGDFNTGAYASWGPTVANRVPVHACGPYRTPAYRAEAHAVHTNGPVAGAFRGFGVPQATILQESLYDRLARKAGIDRLKFRQINAFKDGDATPCGQVLQGVGIGDCLAALGPAWARAGAWAGAGAAQPGDLRRGIGIASCWYGCGNTALPNPATIRAGIAATGRLYLHQGATDVGQGSNTVIAQIFADALGVSVAEIRLIGPDTALTPDCGKTSASRQTYVTGRAAAAAGAVLRSALLRRANAGGDAEISLAPGAVIVAEAGAETRIALADLAPDARGYVFSAEESYDPPTTPLDANGQGIPYAVYGYGAQIAEVSVDIRLGTVRVHRITAAHDLGRVINPVLAEGQIHGGIAQGLGLALMETYVPGRTENLHDYLIPTIGDMPDIETLLIEKPDPEGPFGAKGLGEHALIPTAPAILNAISDATGACLDTIPTLPDRIMAALGAARGGPLPRGTTAKGADAP